MVYTDCTRADEQGTHAHTAFLYWAVRVFPCSSNALTRAKTLTALTWPQCRTLSRAGEKEENSRHEQKCCDNSLFSFLSVLLGACPTGSLWLQVALIKDAVEGLFFPSLNHCFSKTSFPTGKMRNWMGSSKVFF